MRRITAAPALAVLARLCALTFLACTAPDGTTPDGGSPMGPDGMTGRCAGCGAGQVCVDGACMDVPKACPCPKETYCDLGSNTCKIGCTTDDQCAAGRICDTRARMCMAGCRSDRECGAAQFCDPASATCRSPMGSGKLTAGPTLAAGSSPYGIVAGDLNGDGKVDLAVANYGSNNVSVILSKGGGSFGAATALPVGTEPYWLAIGDLNGDGKPD